MREKIFFLDYMDIECDTAKSKVCEMTHMGQLLKISHQCGVPKDKEMKFRSVCYDKIARSCFVTRFKSLSRQL